MYLLSDGVLPTNVGRGYIVRRLLRRVIVKARITPDRLRARWGQQLPAYKKMEEP